MKRVYKILVIVLILMNLYSMAYITKGTNDDDYDIWETGKDWIDTGIEEKQKDNKLLELNKLSKTRFEKLIDFLWGIGLLAAIITTIILGIKMMTVPPGEKSRVKQALSPYVVGIIIIFGALSIWKLLIQILDGSL